MIQEQGNFTRSYECGSYVGGDSVRGKANAGLTLGIIGTVLGAAALWNRNGGGIGNLLGGSVASSGVPTNVNINGGLGGGCGCVAPTTFETYAHECEDVLALTNTLWAQKVDTMKGFYDYRNVDVAEKFGLYKDNRDNLDGVNNRINNELFSLYKYTRDKDDAINERISALEKEVAVNSSVRPYQDRLIQCEIDKAFNASINYTDRKTCKMITGVTVIPSTPTITGYGSYCCGQQAAAGA
jgi:hypothetical protein